MIDNSLTQPTETMQAYDYAQAQILEVINSGRPCGWEEFDAIGFQIIKKWPNVNGMQTTIVRRAARDLSEI